MLDGLHQWTTDARRQHSGTAKDVPLSRIILENLNGTIRDGVAGQILCVLLLEVPFRVSAVADQFTKVAGHPASIIGRCGPGGLLAAEIIPNRSDQPWRWPGVVS
ncbi:predicted protein [Aspergillus terreus NIH2624]|uniref:Uncharacterized protein n=1 Tax=Aspergillus terreus (strain NIH 2624 / FGSC A1156) TaxID=341663 RepID=Q0C8E0_ASPTN|nr:uncharacterized protein ATEG_10044 [Aspergillus terreus NIH2624]EAU29493.1 predicted protein [Aspergillus terreus NIH2624]